MISIYHCKGSYKKHISNEETIQSVFITIADTVWLQHNKQLKSVYFVHRTTRENELMVEIQNEKGYYLLKCDDAVNIQNFQNIADAWRDEWRN